MPDSVNRRLLDVVSTLADELISRLDADACVISRVIGDVLIVVASNVREGGTMQQGQGYLVTDFPQTAEVLRARSTRTLTLDDPDLDEAEAGVLEMHGLGALVMVPLELNGDVWGLVEVYRRDRRPFSDEDARVAQELSRLT